MTIERKERTATLVIDDTYVARATSPGGNNTLDIDNNRLYLGASVDKDGKTSNGFTGCITGAKLNYKDLPVSGSTKDYVANPSSGVESGCTFEPPQEGAFPTVVTFAAGGIGFIILFIIVPILLVICIGGGYAYRRRKKYSPGRRHASMRSPTFNWQPRLRTPETGNSRHRLMLSQSSQVSASDSFALQDVNQGQTQAEGSIFPPSTPRVSECAFTTPEQSPEQPQRRRNRLGETLDLGGNQQDAPRSHHIRRLDFQQDEQQPHPPHPPKPTARSAKAVEPPSIPKLQTQLSNESTTAAQPPTLDLKHVRSLSGHLSTGTMGTEKSEATSVFDDSEVGRYVLKRIVAANEDLESIQIDQMMPFKEEGEFEPLGSVGSLYDILREGDENFEPLQRSVSLASRPPLKPKPQLSSRSNKLTESHTIANGTQSIEPTASQNIEVEKQAERTSSKTVHKTASSHHAKSNGAPPQSKKIEQPKKTRDKRRRNRAVPAVGEGESLMDKFQKMGTSPSHVGDDGGKFV